MRSLLLVVLSILAFAGNSILTRAAFAIPRIDPALFAGVRLASGAIVLALIGWFRREAIMPRSADAWGIALLSLYAVAFTFAYVWLGAATGALILFAAVQLAIFGIAALRGSVLRGRDFVGLGAAMAGLAWLLAPGLAAPPLGATLLMIVAGTAWSSYTLLGRAAVDPIARTARNFIGACPLAIGLIVVAGGATASRSGLALAIGSGAVTSAMGYAVWYSVLPRISAATAGASQLLVPVVASAFAPLTLGEALTGRMLAPALLILAGVALTILPARRAPGGQSA
jgi:drug/metabolite transporter (DMT)-like permease